MARGNRFHKVPVIAITGYLGAGKTTLLNHLLRRPGARVGVVINDFGKLNVDAALVEGQINEAASISGGCLCCLPDTGGLDEALERLSQPRLRLDAIVIEASGVADPLALARIIRFSDVERIRPGGIIEVVDAVEYFNTVDIWPEPPARYAAASLVVIGKSDLLPDAERDQTLDRIRDRIRQRNPQAQFVISSHGRIDPELVFDVASEEDPPDQLPIARLIRESQPHTHEHARAVSVELPDPVSPTALVTLMENPPEGAYRIKGRVCVLKAGRERGYLVNLVGRTIHVAPLDEPPLSGELVAIGMHLDVDGAERRLGALAGSQNPSDEAGLASFERYLRHAE